MHRQAGTEGLIDATSGPESEEVAFGRAESLAAGFEREADVELAGEDPISLLFGVSCPHHDLPGSGAELENGRSGNANDRLVPFFSRRCHDAEIETQTVDAGRSPGSEKGNIGKPRDGVCVDSVFLKGAIKVRDCGLNDPLIGNSIGRVEAVAVEDGLNLAGVRDFLIAAVKFVTLPISVVQGEAPLGGVVVIKSANWRGREFSGVSSVCLIEKQGREESGSDLEFHERRKPVDPAEAILVGVPDQSLIHSLRDERCRYVAPMSRAE